MFFLFTLGITTRRPQDSDDITELFLKVEARKPVLTSKFKLSLKQCIFPVFKPVIELVLL